MLKKLFTFLLPVMVLAGCSVEEFNDSNIEKNEYPEFSAYMEDWDGETKAMLGPDLKILFDEDENIVVYNKSNQKNNYIFQGTNNSQTGKFTFYVTVTSPDPIIKFQHNIAIAPYSDRYTITEQGDQISNVLIPENQHYFENSFDQHAFPMLAVSDDNNLYFKNAASLIQIQLTGTEKITSIFLENEVHNLSGQFSLTYDAEGLPKLNEVNDEKIVSHNWIKLDCGKEGVQLDPVNPTSFYLSVKPGEFSKGFSITVNDASGKSNTYTSSGSFNLARNQVLSMPVIKYVANDQPESAPALNEIWVKTIDGNQPKDMMVAAEKVPNTEFWKYVIPEAELLKCNQRDVITSIPKGWLNGHSEFTEIKLPITVEEIGYYAFEGCSNLKTMDLSRLKDVEEGVFSGCSALESVILPQTKEYIFIKPCLFYECKKLQTLEIPSNVKVIQTQALLNCLELNTLVLNEGLEEIAPNVFGNNTLITSLTIPSTVKQIYAGAFENFTGLKTVKILSNNGQLIYKSAIFENCPKLENIWFYPAPRADHELAENIFCVTKSKYTLHLNPAWQHVNSKPLWIYYCEHPYDGKTQVSIVYDADPTKLVD